MRMDHEQDRKGAGVKIPPPLIFLGTTLIGYLIGFIQPLRIGESNGIMLGGSLLLALALIIISIAALTFRRVKTHLEPWKPTSTIVTGGIFAISRNPIYLAFCCANIGLGMIFNSWWILLSFLPTAILIYFVAIKPEEIYLERNFGGEYLEYKMRVRRWL
jgi:protein-S-isoprenylcysteine O-methyltransferase Ste14